MHIHSRNEDVMWCSVMDENVCIAEVGMKRDRGCMSNGKKINLLCYVEDHVVYESAIVFHVRQRCSFLIAFVF